MNEVFPYRHDALFATLTEDTYLSLRQIHISIRQSQQLRLTHTCLVQHLDDQGIA